jgi:hypothetical protein
VVSQETLDELTAGGIDITEVMSGVNECDGLLQSELDNFGGNRPVSCVDVCDARAYCAWAGKRLCGRIAGDLLDVTQGAGQGVHIDPEDEMGRCIDAGLSPNVIYEVGSNENCVGGYPGLYDMSGNVGEWDNSCTNFSGPPPTENCLARGGAYYNGFMGDDPLTLSCDFFRDTLQSGPSASIGFRCCSD